MAHQPFGTGIHETRLLEERLEIQIDGASEQVAGANTGGLLSPTACFSGPLGGGQGVYEVAIAWRGLNEHVDPILDDCGDDSGKYGAENEFRHILVMRTFVNND